MTSKLNARYLTGIFLWIEIVVTQNIHVKLAMAYRAVNFFVILTVRMAILTTEQSMSFNEFKANQRMIKVLHCPS